ncbi:MULTISPECIES: class I SAM-dependent methyltransferase [Fischerella]|uniref:Class I SAM-dependent methyltransferase n=1 Tax=Fischerella muscicola CCMEE 5323 TaxID=2019572 RepID=A0A2N6K079_FISMU|nr:MULTISPECIES: methyltransferase domain-containing protein [Fischerella]MBD2434683.1 class I SAM-dependent methyltransferase [Fischerella sp. FACHB-380]PLZ87367.1 class I SAM-dependent methyltransferase [Fischerella muscicola CCMEE 5323]
MKAEIIQEQIAYYSARAEEYDEWFYRQGRYDRGREINQLWFDEVSIVENALFQIGRVENVLELACGTGIWTQKLLNIGNQITALDASVEVLEINRSKLVSNNIVYRQVDLFAWQPDAEYDLVFFSFWLSHVPPELVDSFLKKVNQSVRFGGKLFIIDSRFAPLSTAKDHILENDGNVYKQRKLNDGREFSIVKIFYQQEELKNKLTKFGFDVEVKVTDNYFIYAYGHKID